MGTVIQFHPRLQRETFAPKVIAYLRRSTDDDERQVASLPRQRKEIEEAFGPIEERFIFEDKETGSDWSRPGLRRMYEWCRLHEKAPEEPVGIIACWDESRFGRPVNDRMTAVDLAKYEREIARFLALGWQVISVRERENSTGSDIADAVLRIVNRTQAGEKLVGLSRDVKSGLQHLRENGYWGGGIPPFPTVRCLADTGEVIPEGARFPQRKQILGLDPSRPERLQAWIDGAKMLLDGQSFRLVAEMYNERGIPTGQSASRKGRAKPMWHGRTLLQVYTSESLIGKIRHKREGAGHVLKEEPELYDAKWPPLVPVDLWHAVQRELARRSAGVPKRIATSRDDALLRPWCPKCRSYYYHAIHAGIRYYSHPTTTNGGVGRERRQRIEAAGCRGYSIPAERIETRIRELISRERGTPRFEQHIEKLLSESDSFQDAAQARVEQTLRALADLEEEMKAARRFRTKAEAKGNAEEVEELTADLEELRGRKERLRTDLAGFERERDESSQGADAIRARIRETRAILEQWDFATPHERRKLIAWWLRAVHIHVEDTGKRKSRNRVALVQLRSDPRMMEVDLRPEYAGYDPAAEEVSTVSNDENIGEEEYMVAVPEVQAPA
jgi:hypothetical protein